MNPTIDWHDLSGRQIQALIKALLHAFPQRATLAQMLRFNMDVNLDHIASGGNMQEVVFQLVEWSQSSGRNEELFNSALEQAPGNPMLRAFAAEFSASGGGESDANSSTSSTQTAAEGRGFSASGNVTESNIITGDSNTINYYYTDGGAKEKEPTTDPSANEAPAEPPSASQLQKALTQLVSAQFESVVFAVDHGNVIPGRNMAQAERAIELMRLARSKGEDGLTELWVEIQRVKG